MVEAEAVLVCWYSEESLSKRDCSAANSEAHFLTAAAAALVLASRVSIALVTDCRDLNRAARAVTNVLVMPAGGGFLAASAFKRTTSFSLVVCSVFARSRAFDACSISAAALAVSASAA